MKRIAILKMIRALVLSVLPVLLVPTASVAQMPDADCALPRVPPSPLDKLYPTRYGADAPVDPDRFSDPEVFDCLLRTAEKGTSREAVEWAQILLWEGHISGQGVGGWSVVGGLFPRSESRLKKYIDIGVQQGSHYSILAKAAYLQDIDPATALELYRRIAKEDDCRGQFMLAWMYQQGIGVEINEAVAYFWARLASRRQYVRAAPGAGWGDSLTHNRPVPYFEQRASAITTSNRQTEWRRHQECGDLRGIVDLARLEKAPFAEDVHDSLLQWRPGQDASDALGRYVGYQSDLPDRREKAATHDSKGEQDFISRVTWKPVAAKFAQPAIRARSMASLYDELSKSVYIIVAASSVRDMRARTKLAQGSAVAVDFKTLITNCHIIEGRPVVYLATRDGLSPLNIFSTRVAADTCVLAGEKDQFVPVPRVRAFESLRVGETVFAIGAPSGFANTLSTGIVSQLRTLDRQRLIQTTAAISGGSSGGGLFDDKGNLIGITTFRIKDADSLNFAISIDEYLRP